MAESYNAYFNIYTGGGGGGAFDPPGPTGP
jgi:hypothetical protein